MDFAYGVDLGWLTQLEALGYRWVDDEGNDVDAIAAAKTKGVNAVRLRVFVDPPKNAYWTKLDGTVCMLGYCDAQSVLQAAKRVKAHGMDLMVDFHYSDHFADPQYQDIPADWMNATDAELGEHIYRHTVDVLTLLRDNSIEPRWVEVGNEINSGILLPRGSFKENPQVLSMFLNQGYEAVKQVFPACSVITHLTMLYSPAFIENFLDTFFENGGKTDILGFSHYPYWFNLLAKMRGTGQTIERTSEYLLGYLKRYHDRYKLPVMIAEVGEEDSEEQVSFDLLDSTVKAVKALGDAGVGVFYWEPEVCAQILPDQYPLGAARLVEDKRLQYTKALNAFMNNK